MPSCKIFAIIIVPGGRGRKFIVRPIFILLERLIVWANVIDNNTANTKSIWGVRLFFIQKLRIEENINAQPHWIKPSVLVVKVLISGLLHTIIIGY